MAISQHDRARIFTGGTGLPASNFPRQQYGEHTIEVEEVREQTEHETIPHCLGGELAAPRDDRGGIDGYEELLAILNKPNHKRYASVKEWLPLEFDPEQFDVEEVNQQLLGGDCKNRDVFGG